jgi:hypothetical protein
MNLIKTIMLLNSGRRERLSNLNGTSAILSQVFNVSSQSLQANTETVP